MGLTRPRAHQVSDSDYKQSVRVVSESNVTLSGGAPATVDGVSLALGDRVLVAGQTAGAENGLYKVTVVGTGSNGTWARTKDGDDQGDITAGMTTMVTAGTDNADKRYKLTTNDPITIGTTALTFQVAGGGAGTPGGSDTQLQFNDGGSFGGVTGLTYNKVTEDLTATGNINLGDNDYINIGAGPDLSIYHDGTDTYFDDVGTGSIFLRSGTTYVQNAAGTKTSLSTNSGAGQSIYYNNSLKFETTNTGVGVTGEVSATGNIDGSNVNVSDTLRIAQSGSGLRMTDVGAFDNDGSDNFRIFGTNDLILAANGDSGTAITIDSTNQDVAVSNDLTTSGQITATGNVTAGNLVTTGTVTLDRLALNSSQTTVSPLQLTASNLNDGVGALRIDGAQADIFLNPATATHTTVTFAVNDDQRLAFGMDNSSDFYITRRTGGAWYDDTLVIDRDSGEVNLGYGLTVAGDILNGQSDGVGNIGSSSVGFNTVHATATSAQYADLAERYTADQDYEAGTVVVFSDKDSDYELTESTRSHDRAVAGVISTNPAYLMNSTTEGVALALQGRVPCKVVGPINRGELVVTSDVPGTAQRLNDDSYQPGQVIGKALETIEHDSVQTIEIVVGRL